ncbi:MAG: glycosyltransferase [Candidatus Omnitrophota bacterium]|nr:glycosyltransferase [Candidatus Omnitrophota bacterium]
MKKILFLNSTLNTGGAEKMFYEIVTRLDRTQFTARVVCLYGPGTIGQRLISEGMDLRHSVIKNKYDIKRVFKLIKEECPDILCLESSPLVLFWGLVCGRLAGVKGIVTFVHSMKRPGFWIGLKTYIVERIVLSRLERIAVPSMAKLEALKKAYSLDSSKLVLIQNCIDIEACRGNGDINRLKNSIGIKQGEKVIGMVGRLVTEKAYDVFLKSAKDIASIIPESRFVIVGEGRERPVLETLAWVLGIRDKVLFLGERRDAPELISLFDVAVLSSRMESFPVALLEYMANSKSIVSTRAGGSAEIIKDRDTGILVDIENPSMLSKAVIELMLDKSLAERLGRAGRLHLENNFYIGKMMENAQRFFLEANLRVLDSAFQIGQNGRSNYIVKGSKMKVLISTNFKPNMIEAKVKPLVILPEVESVLYVTDTKGPEIPKVRYYVIPQPVLRITGNNAFVRAVFKLFAVFYLGIFKRPDLLIGYGFVPHGIIVEIIGRLFGIPSCVNMIGGPKGLEGWDFTEEKDVLVKFLRRGLSKLFLRVADKCGLIVVTGSSTKNFLISKGGVKSERIKIIPSTIDVNRFFPERNGGYKYDIIILSQLIPTKRIDIFLEVVLRLKKLGFNLKAIILGEGALRKQLEDMAKGMGLNGAVEFAGFRRDVEKYLKTSRIFLFPSVKEGLSLGMMEAMACGVVPVVFNVDDLGDAVKDRFNGRVVERGDTDSFVVAAAELLKDPDAARVYSESAVDFIRRNYTIQNAAQAWKEVLGSLKRGGRQ